MWVSNAEVQSGPNKMGEQVLGVTNMNETLEFLKRLAEEINAQENYGTADPIYCIQELKSIPVVIPNDDTKTQWVSDDGEVAEGEQADMLQAYWEKYGMEPNHWNLEHFREEWVHTGQTYLTLKSARDFIEGNDNLRVYVNSAHNNHEIREIRRLLSGPLLQWDALVETARDSQNPGIDAGIFLLARLKSKSSSEIRDAMREALRQTLEGSSIKQKSEENAPRDRPQGG